MRTIFSTLAALAAGLIAAVAMGQEGGRDPAPSAMLPGTQQPGTLAPTPEDATQPAPPPVVETDSSALGRQGTATPLSEPTQTERRLESRIELKRELDRTEALDERNDSILKYRDIGREAAAIRANRKFNDYRNNRIPGQVRLVGADNGRWRYVRHNNQWWYWTPENTWLIWSGNRWLPQDEFNRLYVSRQYPQSYRTGYRGDGFDNDYYYDGGYYGPGRGYYGRGYYGRGYYGRGYYGRGYFGPGYGYGAGYYGPGYYRPGIGGAIGGAIGGW